MTPLEELSGKKIAILGLSIEGSSTAKFLEGLGLSFTVLDQKSAEQFDPQLLRDDGNGRIRFILGPRYLDKLGSFDLIFRTPGFPLWHPRLLEAQKSGAKITSQTKLFFDLCSCPIIGVTGTKGKGTTSKLAFEMLSSSGFNTFLGGNIGDPPLDFLPLLKKDSVVVLELSSFQIEDLNKSPHIAVVLMTTQEHLSSQSFDSPNFHRSREEYVEAKRSIVRFQRADDFAVINRDYEASKSFAKDTRGQTVFFSTQSEVDFGSGIEDGWLTVCLKRTCLRLLRKEEVFLRGEHNLQNVLAAATAALLFGSKVEKVVEVAKSFKGLEHRLEFVREINSVKYYNDSFSTTPETAIAAINSFIEPLVLILGGSEKGSDYTELGQAVARSGNIRAVLLVGVTAGKIKDSILKILGGPRSIDIREGFGSMNEVVGKSFELAKIGDVVLLSPACASFDMFKNYRDRGHQFKEAVNFL